MAKIRFNLLEGIFLILFSICSKKCNAKLRTNEICHNVFDFEEIKLNIFTTHLSELGLENITENDEKCSKEISAIKIGLKNNEHWAIKSNFKFIPYL